MLGFPRFSKFFSPLLTVFLLGYFSYHLIRGDRGLLAWVRLEKQYAKAERCLAEWKEKNHSLREKVLHLSNKSLDLDLLGEQAYALELAHPEDILILVPDYTFSSSLYGKE
ncbi:MAG: septum formation initiator family protein [Holosporales bacterium]|jgi:cell division protein FtsB|nr:septum formation initiator family protein [Holosporales bacterium]